MFMPPAIISVLPSVTMSFAKVEKFPVMASYIGFSKMTYVEQQRCREAISMNYVKMTCISITTPITSNIKLPQFYAEIGNRVFSPVVLGDDREKGLGQDRIAEP